MKIVMRLPVVFALLTLGLALPSVADERADKDRIAILVSQLGSPKFTEREAAMERLEAIGPAALESLRKAAASKDLEIRRRAEMLVRKLELRQESIRLTTPGRIRLNYTDIPIEEAVADLAKRTGLVFKLDGARAALAERRVTVVSDETTIWEAFDLFCRKAGLVETPPVPVVEKNKPRTGVSSSIVMIGGNRPIATKDVLASPASDKPEIITLSIGEPRTLPTCYGGAVRLQAHSPLNEINGQRQMAGEVLLGLNIASEASLRWQRVVGLNIDRARDDQGQELLSLPVPLVKPAPPRVNTGGTVIINGVPLNPDPPPAEGVVKQAPIRLRLGEKPSAVLKELTGTIAGLVRSAVEPIVTVDNVLKSVDQTVAGEKGGAVKMLAVKREADGRVSLSFQVEVPPVKIDDGSAPPRTNVTVIINGKMLGQQDEEPLSAANFALLDEQGRPFKAVKATNTGRQSGAKQEFDFVFEPGQGQGEPWRFVYSGQRAAIIEVPFRLENVPLR